MLRHCSGHRQSALRGRFGARHRRLRITQSVIGQLCIRLRQGRPCSGEIWSDGPRFLGIGHGIAQGRPAHRVFGETAQLDFERHPYG